MIDLEKQLLEIKKQKIRYRMLLEKCRDKKRVEDSVWQQAAESASIFDLAKGKKSEKTYLQNQKGLSKAFETVRQAPKKELTLSFIMDVHGQALEYANPSATGHLRHLRARWLNSTMILSNWEKVPFLMDNLVAGINNQRVPAFYWEEAPNETFQRLSYDPVMQAIEANYNTVATHPFSDGNKRAARLVSAWILDKYNHIPLSIEDRESYISAIENYFGTRHPHEFYNVMLAEMRRSYHLAIGQAEAASKAPVPGISLPENPKKKAVFPKFSARQLAAQQGQR